MAKEKEKLIEDMTFDSYAYAKDVYEESKRKIEKIKLGIYISAGATAVFFAMLLLNKIFENSPNFIVNALTAILLIVWFAGAIVSYIVGGGLKLAFKAAKKIAFFGWLILPFPWDLLPGLLSFGFSIYLFFCVPVVFILINYFQAKKNYTQAEEAMKYYKPAETPAES